MIPAAMMSRTQVPADPGQHFGQPRARDRPVHDVVVGRHAPGRGEGRLAPEPEALAFGLVRAGADGARARPFGDAADPGHELVDLDAGAVQFADEDRFRVPRIAGTAEALRRLDRRPVHHFEPGGDDPGGDDVADAGPRRFVVGKAHEERPHGRRFGQDAHRDFGDHAEQPLGAGDRAEQIVALGVELLAAQTKDLAAHEHHLDAEQVVGREAVFEAVHAARILRDVAADGAGDLARRIRRVVEAVGGHGRADGEIGDSGLDHGAAVGGVDLEDAVELAEAHGHPVGEGQRAARKPGAGAARHHLDAARTAKREDAAHLAGAARQDDDHRQRPIGAETIAFEGAQRARVVDDVVGREDVAQRGDEVLAPSDHARVGLGHRDHGETASRTRFPAAAPSRAAAADPVSPGAP